MISLNVPHLCVVYFLIAFPFSYHTVMQKFSAQFPAQTAVKEVPAYRRVPSARWLLSVYVADCYTRLAELKANITSTFSTVLKMDSTKRVVRKLSGSAKGTAAWSTNVGNEHGQVREREKKHFSYANNKIKIFFFISFFMHIYLFHSLGSLDFQGHAFTLMHTY